MKTFLFLTQVYTQTELNGACYKSLYWYSQVYTLLFFTWMDFAMTNYRWAFLKSCIVIVQLTSRLTVEVILKSNLKIHKKKIPKQNPYAMLLYKLCHILELTTNFLEETLIVYIVTKQNYSLFLWHFLAGSPWERGDEEWDCFAELEAASLGRRRRRVKPECCMPPLSTLYGAPTKGKVNYASVRHEYGKFYQADQGLQATVRQTPPSCSRHGPFVRTSE